MQSGAGQHPNTQDTSELSFIHSPQNVWFWGTHEETGQVQQLVWTADVHHDPYREKHRIDVPLMFFTKLTTHPQQKKPVAIVWSWSKNNNLTLPPNQM